MQQELRQACECGRSFRRCIIMTDSILDSILILTPDSMIRYSNRTQTADSQSLAISQNQNTQHYGHFSYFSPLISASKRGRGLTCSTMIRRNTNRIVRLVINNKLQMKQKRCAELHIFLFHCSNTLNNKPVGDWFAHC